MTIRLAALTVLLTTLASAAESSALFHAIRQGLHAEAKSLIEAGADVNAPRADGVTPLIQAVLTSDAQMVALLLAQGASVKAKTEFGVTALHAAAYHLEKTRLLLAAGADPNAASSNGTTPLFSAVVRAGAGEIVDELIRAGGQVTLARKGTSSSTSVLRAAAATGDLALLKQLVEHGAEPKTQDPIGAAAVKSRCIECVRFLLGKGAKVTEARVADAAAIGSLDMLKLLVESGGAPVTDRSDRGYTPLMRAALSYERNQDVIAYLLAKGADPTLKNETGATAHTMAKRFGPSATVEVLRKAGAPESDAPVVPPPVKDNALRPAIERGVKLLEHSAYSVFKRRGCVSCHSNTQPAMVVAAARSAGFAVDEPEAKRNWAAMTADERARGAGSMMGTGIPEISAYTMLAWHANREPAGARSDLAFHQLAARQEPDGHWRVDDYRPPQEYSAVAATGLAVLGLKAYAPPGRAAEAGTMIDRARQYLLRAKPHGMEEHAFRLLGLYWSGATAGAVREAARVLVREQRDDGGWAQLPGMAPDAYATGLALYSLNVTAGIPVTNAVYRRGVRHLLDTQRPDGSWFVESRSFPFQPHFESGFPYGHNQWISAAGSSWALLALIASAGV